MNDSVKGRSGGRREGTISDDSVPTIKLLAKMSEILSVLAEAQSLSATQIADLVDEPRSSIYRLLRTMRALGYVERVSRGRFVLGVRLLQLGAGVRSRLSLREAALPHMWELRDETDSTVLLFVKRGERAVCVERFDGKFVRLEITDVGDHLPLHAGASPRLMLAMSSPDEIAAVLDGSPLETWTPHSPRTDDEIRQLLVEISRSGVAVSDQDLVLGVASIAAPIYDYSGALVGAMSLSGLAESMLGPRRSDSIALVKEAAEATSRDLGYKVNGVARTDRGEEPQRS